jgi:PGF-pre-PGF domain-containing protein
MSASTTAATRAETAPPVTITVNIGGDSKAWQAIVTGTKLSELIVTGTVQSGPGANQAAPPGTVYQYIRLVPARFTSISKALIHFTIPQVWLDENHIDPKSIVLYHQTANGWEELPTTVLYTKGGTVYFSAESAGFSLFAITGMPSEVTPATIAILQEITGSVVQAPAPAAAVKAPITTQTTAPPAASAKPAAPSPLLNTILVIAAIGILAGAGFIIRRWWVQRQNPTLFAEYD